MSEKIMTKAHIVLDRVALMTAVLTTLTGVFLMSFGLALHVQERGQSHSFPNTQHITPTPYPGERR